MLKSKAEPLPETLGDPAPTAALDPGEPVGDSPLAVLAGKSAKKRARSMPGQLEPAAAILRRAVRTLRSVGPAMPTPESVSQEMADARRATKRGYFTPDEDERVRAAFAKFLQARAVLEETIASGHSRLLAESRLFTSMLPTSPSWTGSSSAIPAVRLPVRKDPA